jgi:hypothetical protein
MRRTRLAPPTVLTGAISDSVLLSGHQAPHHRATGRPFSLQPVGPPGGVPAPLVGYRASLPVVSSYSALYDLMDVILVPPDYAALAPANLDGFAERMAVRRQRCSSISQGRRRARLRSTLRTSPTAKALHWLSGFH